MKNLKPQFLHSRYIFVAILFCCFSLPSILQAAKGIDKEPDEDALLAAVWLMTQMTEGGYLKPAINITRLNNDVSPMIEIEAGWRFTHWLKFGASLKRTLVEVDFVKNHVTAFGFIAGVSGRNLMLENYTIDLNIGSLDTGSRNSAQYYVEPGLHLKRHFYKRLHWTSGITYRYVDKESFSLLGNNSLSSLNFKFAIVSHIY